MKRILLAIAVSLLVCLGPWLVHAEQRAGRPAATQPAAVRPGTFRVAVVTYEWTDPARNRPVPVKIYYPGSGEGPFPLIVFSHGLGGSRDSYAYLGQRWAGHGYVCLHLQHEGSDSAACRPARDLMEATRQAAGVLVDAFNRPADVRFVIDQAEKLNADKSPLTGRIDLDHIGMAGHSFGGYTTLAVAGEVFFLPDGSQKTMADPRVKAAIAMSSPVPAAADQLDVAFGGIRIPCLHMTGTCDDFPIGPMRHEQHRLPFDHARLADAYLITFQDADHFAFAIRRNAKDQHFHELIGLSSTAFWDAYLKDDPAARAYLAQGGFAAAMRRDGTLEIKLTTATTRPQ